MELKYEEGPFVYCGNFDRFVEEAYGRKYSTVQGYSGDDRLGHWTYFSVDAEQWEYDQEYAKSEEHAKWVAEFEAKYGPSMHEPDKTTSFNEWLELEGWAAHNDCPIIDEMVWHLRKDGYDIPAKFEVLVDW